ncbi:T-cell activation inhibitor, mitochondrial-like isoform X1 [Centruroides sculpturatus]|uniref:T-cell activation inhibitor, mitochondrial-like isoform X1 n=1 Tax=Centruroides sculpturatus TaxID=218467 RepID=UPI000C6E6409|nr:T-cell activation inhibitor, mitochondrial-like isoform X1 [Centruroides sculpturatus]
MASNVIRRCGLYFFKKGDVSCRFYRSAPLLTAQEVATALRPFYFAVHPDLFWQYPKEKEINENSLKQLNEFLETLIKNHPNYPTCVTFYLRDTKSKANVINTDNFKSVKIKLLGRDIHKTVHAILSACQLSTEYLDQLHANKNNIKSSSSESRIEFKVDFNAVKEWKIHDITFSEVKQKIEKEPEVDLKIWLSQNISKAQEKLKASQPIRDEVSKLRKELKSSLELKNLFWKCGWGISHFRGCLLSFRSLAIQHPDDMKVLKGRTLVFALETGVSLDSHVILSSEDVRHNWLDLIKSVHQYDNLLAQAPSVQKALSDVLRGITINHREFRQSVMVKKYMQQLQKLTSALYRYYWKNGYPDSWPDRLNKFQLAVECEAGPLMLSPTGQFIVPASCPAFLLIDFISKHMEEAQLKMEEYKRLRREEWKLYDRCMTELGLASLDKDDNVTPDLMVQCCRRLLDSGMSSIHYLRNCRLRISHYYSILQDGEMCIPWNWKDDQTL